VPGPFSPPRCTKKNAFSRPRAILFFERIFPRFASSNCVHFQRDDDPPPPPRRNPPLSRHAREPSNRHAVRPGRLVLSAFECDDRVRLSPCAAPRRFLPAPFLLVSIDLEGPHQPLLTWSWGWPPSVLVPLGTLRHTAGWIRLGTPELEHFFFAICSRLRGWGFPLSS